MDDSSGDRPWGYFLILGGLALVAIGLLVIPGILSPTPGSQPRPTRTPDPHLVVTEGGTIEFGLERNAIVIRRTTAGVTTELGRTVLPDEMMPFASGDPLNGSAGFAMVCPSTTGSGSDRFVFGHIDGTGITYRGPKADGQGAPDGLFLFALRPGEVGDSVLATVESSSGSVGVSGRSFGLATSEGKLQPSGCHVEG
jgi:hypothetical protein